MSTATQSSTSVPYPANTTSSVRRVNVVPARARPHKFLEGKKGEEISWDSSNIGLHDLLFIRNCSDMVLKITTPITKLLVGTSSSHFRRFQMPLSNTN